MLDRKLGGRGGNEDDERRIKELKKRIADLEEQLADSRRRENDLFSQMSNNMQTLNMLAEEKRRCVEIHRLVLQKRREVSAILAGEQLESQRCSSLQAHLKTLLPSRNEADAAEFEKQYRQRKRLGGVGEGTKELRTLSNLFSAAVHPCISCASQIATHRRPTARSMSWIARKHPSPSPRRPRVVEKSARRCKRRLRRLHRSSRRWTSRRMYEKVCSKIHLSLGVGDQ